jgi:NADH-quinone oxidoreductase subunit N
MSLPLYVLLGSKKSIINIGSSVKYFITGAVISVFMLLGVSLIYGYFGTTHYLELSDLLLSQKEFSSFDTIYLGFCFLLILVTFFFKLGLAPFHFWVADLYEGGPLIVIFFITLVPKLAMFMAFYKLFIITIGDFILANFYIYEICYATGLFSVLVGS